MKTMLIICMMIVGEPVLLRAVKKRDGDKEETSQDRYCNDDDDDDCDVDDYDELQK